MVCPRKANLRIEIYLPTVRWIFRTRSCTRVVLSHGVSGSVGLPAALWSVPFSVPSRVSKYPSIRRFKDFIPRLLFRLLVSITDYYHFSCCHHYCHYIFKFLPLEDNTICIIRIRIYILRHAYTYMNIHTQWAIDVPLGGLIHRHTVTLLQNLENTFCRH